MDKLRGSAFKAEPEFWRPIRAFQKLDISKSRGYEALQKGEIPFVRICGLIRIPRSWVEEQSRKALAAVADDA